jgi:hypothetical protein
MFDIRNSKIKQCAKRSKDFKQSEK